VKNNNNADNPVGHTPTKNRTDSRPVARQTDRWTETSSDWIAPSSTTAAKPQATSAVSLEAQGISVSYGAKQILSEISFDIHEGDIVGLLGLNGAGKSTSRMHIGYAPDKPAIYPEFSVTEFLHFIARMRRIEKHRIKACINKVIERCALGDAQKRIIGNLSTGYQQRVNIAQALIHTPKILILDEPANGLDPVQLIDLRTLITTLAEDQATVFSSHLLPEVSSVCNRVILINNGEQILNAPMESLTNKSNSSFEIRLNGSSELHLQELPDVTHASSITTDHWLVTGQSLTAEKLQTILQSKGLQASQINTLDNYLEGLFQHMASAKAGNPSAASINNQGKAA